jgi:hypothetical protein
MQLGTMHNAHGMKAKSTAQLSWGFTYTATMPTTLTASKRTTPDTPKSIGANVHKRYAQQNSAA